MKSDLYQLGNPSLDWVRLERHVLTYLHHPENRKYGT